MSVPPGGDAALPPDARVVRSWQRNAAPWTRAVRDGAIASRIAVTNAAIIDAVAASAPATLLDVGCGEGWLCHHFAQQGVACVGVDVVPALVEQARAAHPAHTPTGDYRTVSYEDIAAGALITDWRGRFDVAVSNFALIGDEAVAQMLRALPPLLSPRGILVIQTLHPVTARGDAPYVDGWREGSWAGFSDDFTDPAPWYFRTISSWVDLVRRCGYTLEEMREPVHPSTGAPSSLILRARVHA